jgi:hypothetical protein
MEAKAKKVSIFNSGQENVARKETSVPNYSLELYVEDSSIMKPSKIK